MNRLKLLKKNKLLIIVAVIYIILFIIMPEKGTQSVKNSTYYIIEMLEIMPVIFLLTSLLEAWVPREIIINSFGEKSGIKGSIFSFMLGSFSAGPIYAAFPVCKMLLKKGASIANIVIILSTWAVIKVPMLANEAKFLGVKFMGIRWILTTISIFVMAYIVSKLVKKESISLALESDIKQITTAEVKKKYCIGCSLCAKLSPEHFKMIDGKAVFNNKNMKQKDFQHIKNIASKCPAKAIYFK